MSTVVAIDAALLERLSALADGELDGAAAASACASWGCEPAARATWHTYHLIGDVLRSEDLAGDPARDAAFIGALRSRLAGEPVRVDFSSQQTGSEAAAADAAGPAGGFAWRWKAASAVAAGFVAVAGVFMLTRAIEPSASLASAPAGNTSVPAAALAPVGDIRVADAQTNPALSGAAFSTGNGRVVRDARLDGYLAAHKQFAGSSALGVPSAFLRSATVEGPGR
jgi:sigma-E factor negative regulatory protein RseA